MTKVIVDSGLSSQLQQGNDRKELCDESGQTIGVFLSPFEHERLKQLETDFRRLQEVARLRARPHDAELERHRYAWAQAQFTEAELDAAEQQPEDYSTEEVLRHRGSS